MGERCETSLLLSGVKCRSASLQLRAFYFSFCEHHCLKLFIVIIMICSVFIYYIYEALCCNTVAAVCCQGLSVAVCQCELMLWGVLSVWTDAVRCVVSVNWCCEVCCQCELMLWGVLSVWTDAVRCVVSVNWCCEVCCQCELMLWGVLSVWTDAVRCGVLSMWTDTEVWSVVSVNWHWGVTLQHVRVNWCSELWIVAEYQGELIQWGVECCSMSAWTVAVMCCSMSVWTDAVRCDVLQHVSVNWCCEVWCVAACLWTDAVCFRRRRVVRSSSTWRGLTRSCSPSCSTTTGWRKRSLFVSSLFHL